MREHPLRNILAVTLGLILIALVFDHTRILAVFLEFQDVVKILGVAATVGFVVWIVVIATRKKMSKRGHPPDSEA